MSEKYLGEVFDIHGGGMDLMFPHHECELAQNQASRGKSGVNYWMHNNMITIKGKKMGKSLGNFITLEELFTGSNNVLDQAYSPMTIRFFILQAHYRSTLDFSNDALKAAEKGLKRVVAAANDVTKINYVSGNEASKELLDIKDKVYEALCDDMNTPIALSHIFDAVKIINSAKDGHTKLNQGDKEVLELLFQDILNGVLGIVDETSDDSSQKVIAGLMEMIIDVRKEAKANKDWATSDKIRDSLKALGVNIKDTKEGCEWSIE